MSDAAQSADSVPRPYSGEAWLAGLIGDRTLRDRLVRLAYRFLWDQHEAEDVAHETLATALEQAATLREPQNWWSWICRIAVRKCHLRGRVRLRQTRHAEHYRKEEAFRQSLRPGSSGVPELAGLLKRLLPLLPRRQFEVVVLRYLEGMSVEEAATILGVASATVRVHAKAALENLRTRIADRDAGLLEAESSPDGD